MSISSKPSLFHRARHLLAAAVIGVAGVTVVAPAPVAADVAVDLQDDAERFLRYRNLRNGGVLETSIVTYQDEQGRTVDLIGAVHVGDEVYYDLLNERFAGYDVLLYEMVKPEGVDLANPQPQGDGETPFAMQLLGALQKGMQLALELEYQTDRIDYSADNFVHADLSLEEFTRLQRERGETFFDLILKQMLRDLTNPQAARQNQPQVSMFEIMDAMDAPDRSRRLKLLFARELSRMDDMTSVFSGDGGKSVILDVRNEKALEVMDEVLERGVDDVGIFYGAAHLDGMEDLLEERGFERVGEPEYLIAWDMTLDGSGRREMRQRTRAAIVGNAAGEGAGDDVAAGAIAALRGEVKALRAENDALRRQVEALRKQNEALQDQADAAE